MQSQRKQESKEVMGGGQLLQRLAGVKVRGGSGGRRGCGGGRGHDAEYKTSLGRGRCGDRGRFRAQAARGYTAQPTSYITRQQKLDES